MSKDFLKHVRASVDWDAEGTEGKDLPEKVLMSFGSDDVDVDDEEAVSEYIVETLTNEHDTLIKGVAYTYARSARVVKVYQDDTKPREVIEEDISEFEAREICSDPDTSGDGWAYVWYYNN